VPEGSSVQSRGAVAGGSAVWEVSAAQESSPVSGDSAGRLSTSHGKFSSCIGDKGKKLKKTNNHPQTIMSMLNPNIRCLLRRGSDRFILLYKENKGFFSSLYSK
jgi:hypothetical protein